VLIFARQLDGPLTSLVKRVNSVVKAHEAAGLQALVVFLGKDLAALQPKLEAMAKKEALSIPLTTAVDADGPSSYKLDPSVQTQVLVYQQKTVQASFSFGSPTEADVDAVVKATEKMLAK